MTKASLLLFLLQMSFLISFGQNSLFLGANAEMGVPFNQYASNRNILKSHLLSSHYSGNFSVQYRMFNRIGIEVGVGQSFQYMRLKDKNFAKRHAGFVADIRNKNQYFSYFTNLQFIQRLTEVTFLYVQGGYSINNIGATNLTESKLFVMDNENVTFQNNYFSKNTSVTGEVGLQFHNEKHLFSIGIKMNFGQQNMFEASYKTEKEGTIISEDKLFSKGTFLGLSIGYKYRLFHKDKKVKAPRRPVENKVAPPVVKAPVTPNPKVEQPPKKLEGREVKVTQRIMVANMKVTIKVWDHQTVDGDRVSLHLNERWILINYTLEKKKKIIEVELQEGRNEFTLHALNLGKYEPNTAAVIINDGVKDYEIILESTLTTSGTIEIIYTPK